MKNKKMIPVCVLAGALTMSLFCSCGQKTAQTNGSAESGAVSVAVSAADSGSAATSALTSSAASATASGTSAAGTTASESASSAAGNSADTRGEAMLGTWRDSVSQRAMMTVKRTDSGFSVIIDWANSAMEYNEWRMTGTFEDVENGRIVSTDCAMYEVSTDANGKTTEKAVYTGEKAHITYVNNMLYWFDAKEDAGADCMFVKE